MVYEEEPNFYLGDYGLRAQQVVHTRVCVGHGPLRLMCLVCNKEAV